MCKIGAFNWRRSLPLLRIIYWEKILNFEIFQGCHSNLRSQIPDIPDILTFCSRNYRHFQCKLVREQISIKPKTTRIIQTCKEKATCVSD